MPRLRTNRAVLVAVALVLLLSSVLTVAATVSVIASDRATIPATSFPSGLTSFTIGNGAGYGTAACSSVTTCNVAMSTAQYSVLLIGIEVDTAVAPSTVAVHGQTTALLKLFSTNAPYVFIYGVLYTAATATLKAYVNFTSSAYYTMTVADATNTVVTSTYSSGTGTATGSTTTVACPITPSQPNEYLFSEVGVIGSETTITFNSGSALSKTATTTTITTGADGYYVDPNSGGFTDSITLSGANTWGLVCVGIEAASVPTAPTALTAGVETSTTVPLSWTDTAAQVTTLSAEAIDYATYSGSACGSYSAASTSGLGTAAGTVTGLTTGTAYCFEVDVSNSTGASAFSTALSNVWTTAVPGAVTGLSASAQAGSTTSLAVTWTLAMVNSGSPVVTNQSLAYYSGASCAGTGTYTNIADAITTTYVITSLTAGTTYSFKSADTNSVGLGAWSSCASATTYYTPSAPSGLSTTAATTNSVSLAWTNPTGQGTILNDTIAVGTSCGAASIWDSTGGAASTYTVSSLNPYTSYCFVVQAWTGGAESAASGTLTVKTNAGYPAAVTSLTATAASDSTVTLTWTDPAPSTGTLINTTVYWFSICEAVVTGLNGYYGTWAPSYSTNLNSGSTLTYTVTGLSPDSSYCFGVALWTQGGQGTQATNSVTTDYSAPQAPSALTYTSASSSAVTMTWTQGVLIGGAPALNDTMAYGTTASCGGTLTFISVGVATSLTVSSLASGTTYYWEAALWTNGGMSGWSTCVTGATYGATPPAPYDLSNQAVTAVSVWVLWVNPAGYSLTDNKVYVSAANGACGAWSQTVDVGLVETSYQVTGLTTGSTYCIEVTAIDAESTFSLPLYITTLGGSGGVGAVGLTGGELTLLLGGGAAALFAVLLVFGLYKPKRRIYRREKG